MVTFTDFFTGLFALITKTLPSDEERLARLKLHSPKIYARVRYHILLNAFRYLKRHRDVKVDEFIKFIGGDLSADEQAYLVTMLTTELNKQ
jgi:hypothetical protein